MKLFRYLTIILFCSTLIAFAQTAKPDNFVFPPDAGVVNVKTDYGAKGDGVTDDTAALKRMLDEHKGKLETIYFPDGTYLVSDSIGIFGGKPHSQDRFLIFQGQSTANTIIKLKDRAPGFGNAEQPKIILSIYEGQSTGDIMHSCVYNLTVDAGTGNAGAVALRFMSNNTGAMRDVVLRSSDPAKLGAIGLDLRQSQNGPCLISNVVVEGFDLGVATGNSFSLVFEHLTLLDQRKLGFRNVARTTIRDLRSRNRETTFLNVKGKGAQLTLVEGHFIGGDPSNAAIVTEDPTLYVRDIKQPVGYGATIQDSKGRKVTGALDEWTETDGYSLFGAKPKSLRLPIKETPVVPWETNLGKWVPVKSTSPAAVQEAFDQAARSGATTVYFPKIKGKYNIDSPIRVYGSVNRILGLEAELNVKDPEGVFKNGTPIFTFDALTSDTIVVERFFLLGGWKGPATGMMFENKAGKTIVLRNLGHSGLTKAVSPRGEWFLEDVAPGRKGTFKVGPGEKVWMRQYNPEAYADEMINVDGGQLWLLGLKTEGRVSHLVATNRAKVEILGGVSYQSWKDQKLNPPMFDITNSDVSATLGIYGSGGNGFATVAQETIGAETKTLPNKIPYAFLPLYRSGK